jgi:transcriptional regulator with XRE-family HTH domain
MKNTGISAIGDRLRFARRAQSLTQVEFAARIGVTHGMISLVETGRTDFSTRGWIQAADILGVSLDWLLRGVGRGPGENNRQRPLDVGNEHALRANQHRRGRRPPNELDTPGDAPGVGAPVGIVGSLPRQVEDRQAG